MTTAVLHAAPPPRFQQLDPATQARLREVAPPAMPVQTLRRTGHRPLTFNGVPIATICGVTPALPFWYELNLFRTVVDSFVCDVRLFQKSDAPERFTVAEHDDLLDACAWFEAYQPARDIRPNIALSTIGSSAELAIAIASLRLEIDLAAEHYRALVGQLLTAVEQG